MVGALLGGAYLERDRLTEGYEVVKDRIEGTAPIKSGELRFRASSQQRGHGVGAVHDGTTTEYWAPAQAGEGNGEWLEATFDSPVRLVHLLLTPGVSAEKEELFVAQGRPSDVRIVIDREDGTTDVQEAHLEDKRGPARIDVGASDVTRVRIVIEDAYRGRHDDARTAIAEVEFWIRK